MHPTISQLLVVDRQATLHAEADKARLTAIARSRAPEAPSRPARQPHARVGLVRRLVDRLATA